MDTEFGTRLRSARKAMGWSQQRLGDESGVKQGTISKIERGNQDESAAVPMLANALGVTALWLATGNGPRLVSDLTASADVSVTALATLGSDSNVRLAPLYRGQVPVISGVQAGDLTDIVDNFAPGDADEWINSGVPVNRHTFALIVEGDSMEPVFTAGMRIVVEPDARANVGDYVIAGNGEQATLKKLVSDGAELYLQPLNPRYPIKPLGDTRIIGVVREAHIKFC